MTYLADTHVAVFWWTGDPALDRAHRRAIEESHRKQEPVGVSAISLWEIAMLDSRGRAPGVAAAEVLLRGLETHGDFAVLPLSGAIVLDSVRLGANAPRDPADRIIAATARVHGLRLLTADRALRRARIVEVI